SEEHDADIPLNVARIYDRQGKLPDARHWYRQAIYIDPFALAPHEGLAAACMKAGDTSAAIAEYRALCALQPENAQRFADAAFAYHKQGDTENARKYAAQAVRLDPNSPAKPLLGS
ncbi:MAG TPA: tetratricopeptide repeat protein, partial [Phycisphaerae bacterium]